MTITHYLQCLNIQSSAAYETDNPNVSIITPLYEYITYNIPRFTKHLLHILLWQWPMTLTAVANTMSQERTVYIKTPIYFQTMNAKHKCIC